MAANRKAGLLATGTVATVLLMLAVFAGVPELGLLPERTAEPPLPETEKPAPPVVELDIATPRSGKMASRPSKAARGPGRGVPLEVSVIDAETGAILPGARPHLVIGQTLEIGLDSVAGRFRHADATVELRRRANLKFRVDLPEGYALERPDAFRVTGVVSRYAQRVRVTIPAWPHALVVVRVLDHAHNPVPGAIVSSASFTHSCRNFTAEPTDADGWTRVRGIPALHGERVSLQARSGQRHHSAVGMVEDSVTPVRLRIVLPEKENGILIGIGGGAGGAFRGRGDHRRKPRTGDECVVVTVRHRDGRSAVDTYVSASGGGATATGRTDANGRVTLGSLPTGTVAVRVSEPGFAAGKAVSTTLEAGKPGSVTIHEAPAKWVTGLVLSETGRALASASVRVRVNSGLDLACLDLVCLDGGVQQLNLLTGPDGRFAFPNVPPGRAVIFADYASRRANAPARDAGITIVEFGPKK